MSVEHGEVNGKASAVNPDLVSRNYKEDIDGEVSLNSFLKTSPFLTAHEEEEEKVTINPHSKTLHKGWHNGNEWSKPKTKVTHSAREMFEECFGKWQNVAYSQLANSDLDSMAEEIYVSRKQETAAIAAALAKRDIAGNPAQMSPDVSCKARKMAKSPCIHSATPPARRNSEREMFMRGDDTPLMPSRKQEAKFNVRMDVLGDSLIR